MSAEVIAGFRAWRLQYREATLQEIEVAGQTASLLPLTLSSLEKKMPASD